MILLLLPLLLIAGGILFISEDALETVLVLIIKALGFFIELIFWPINALLSTVMPQFDSLTANIQPMFDSVSGIMAWLLNSLFITGAALALIIAYFTVTYSVTLGMWGIKVLFAWKEKLL